MGYSLPRRPHSPQHTPRRLRARVARRQLDPVVERVPPDIGLQCLRCDLQALLGQKHGGSERGGNDSFQPAASAEHEDTLLRQRAGHKMLGAVEHASEAVRGRRDGAAVPRQVVVALDERKYTAVTQCEVNVRPLRLLLHVRSGSGFRARIEQHDGVHLTPWH
eukprot:1470598-Prymnesium_polylepis.1